MPVNVDLSLSDEQKMVKETLERVVVEKYYRDARVLAFPDGTIEIQRLIVGREITGIRAFR